MCLAWSSNVQFHVLDRSICQVRSKLAPYLTQPRGTVQRGKELDTSTQNTSGDATYIPGHSQSAHRVWRSVLRNKRLGYTNETNQRWLSELLEKSSDLPRDTSLNTASEDQHSCQNQESTLQTEYLHRWLSFAFPADTFHLLFDIVKEC